jgi:spore germination cell wall hydrolase CwlJ-like protein
MTDADLIALCAFQEANLEPDDGMAAVVRVVLNRAKDLFQSDGSIPGTIFHGNGTAFSWAAFEMDHGHYGRVANGPAEIAARAAQLLSSAQDYKAAWARAQRISQAVVAGTYHGPDYDQLTDVVVMYANLALVSPPWAVPSKFVCRIGHQSFYTA